MDEKVVSSQPLRGGRGTTEGIGERGTMHRYRHPTKERKIKRRRETNTKTKRTKRLDGKRRGGTTKTRKVQTSRFTLPPSGGGCRQNRKRKRKTTKRDDFPKAR